MRISSTQYFNMNVATMSDQQAQLSQLYAGDFERHEPLHAVGQSARRGAGRAVELDGDDPVAIHDQSGHRAGVAAAGRHHARQRQHRAANHSHAGAARRRRFAERRRPRFDRDATAKLAQPADDARQFDRPAGQLPVRRLSKQRAAVHHEFGRRRDLFRRHRHARRADHRLARRCRPATTALRSSAASRRSAPVPCRPRRPATPARA